MQAKVLLEITKGEKTGERFEFSETSRVLIGRQEDCGIVIPMKTVSRYHCLLEIRPPAVRLQDFGSLNGTFINGKKIGQRDQNVSWEEARNQQHQAFDLHDGDVLGLGTQCEIKCRIQRAETCPLCGKALPMAPADENATVLTGSLLPPLRMDDQGRRICEECWKKLEAEKEKRRRQEEELQQTVAEPAPEPVQQDDAVKCKGCGKVFTPTAQDNNLCPACLADRAKVLDGVLAMLNVNAQKARQRQKTAGSSILAGYEKVSLLGKGGMGEVWKVRETETGKEYALKTMLPDVAMDEQAKRLFLREAGICEQIRHPNVVTAYNTGSANGVLYILMDLCEGGSADDLMKKKGGRLSLELATYITLQTLFGLDYVHNLDISVDIPGVKGRASEKLLVRGIVHRDFKPGNIFLSDSGDHPTAMVADFGMAKAFDAAGRSQVSKTGAVMGTPVFMPKQQARDCKYAKPEVDVWAAAASYYYMLTGQFVKNFRPGVNVWQVLITESAVPIRNRDRSIPSALADVIDRALAESPRLYYTSAAALRRDIIAALPDSVKTYCRGIL